MDGEWYCQTAGDVTGDVKRQYKTVRLSVYMDSTISIQQTNWHRQKTPREKTFDQTIRTATRWYSSSTLSPSLYSPIVVRMQHQYLPSSWRWHCCFWEWICLTLLLKLKNVLSHSAFQTCKFAGTCLLIVAQYDCDTFLHRKSISGISSNANSNPKRSQTLILTLKGPFC